MSTPTKSTRLKKLPALTPTYRGKLGWANEDGDRDRLLDVCRLLKGHSSNLIAILWPLYMLGRNKNRELRGTHEHLQKKLGTSVSRKTFITALTVLKDAGLIHFDVQCEKGTSKKFTRIGIREELYVTMLNTRTHAKRMDQYTSWDLQVATRVIQSGNAALSLGRLGGHTDAQRNAIAGVIDMTKDDGLSYGHFKVLKIMHEKLLELKETTGWNPCFPFWHALADDQKRYWPNVLDVFKKKDGIRLVTVWAICAYDGHRNLFGNAHLVNFTSDEWAVIKHFNDVECGEDATDELRYLFDGAYDEIQNAPKGYRAYLAELFSWS